MKHSKLYISAMLFAALAATSCDDNWDTPPMVAPVATIEANTSIEELKTKYWQEANNCVDTIGYKEDGKTHYIIKGRVVSSDESGNIYKNLVIQDTYSEAGETPSCITFSIIPSRSGSCDRRNRHVYRQIFRTPAIRLARIQQLVRLADNIHAT